MFIRVSTSQRGQFDIVLGAAGQVLVSNGADVAPSFQDPPVGTLARGFSYTQPWELEILTRVSGYNFGLGNFTAQFERTAAGSSGHGPANYTTGSDVPYTKRI